MENKCFNGLTTVNIELTNRCQKACWMCGRRKLEKDYPELAKFDKDMDLDLVYKILSQLPSGIIVQFHNNGEPLLYPYLYQTLNFRSDIIQCLNTNAILLLEKADYIIDSLDTLTISVIEDDENDKQYEIVNKFLLYKGNKKPYIIFRLLGNVGIIPGSDNALYSSYREKRWYNTAKKYNCLVVTRILHNPMGSFDYQKKVTIPEIGFCLDLINHLVIDVEGNVFPCVRFNPNKENLLGNVKRNNLIDLWNSELRQTLIQEHIKGNRNYSKLCSKCDYWGVPRGQ